MTWKKLLLFMLLVSLAGCNLPKADPTVEGVDAIKTVAARTVDAMSTQVAGKSTPQPLVTVTMPAATVTPAGATATQGASPTARLSQTAGTASPCDQAAYIRDVTIPDGTLFLPGTKFIKTWEIKNTGSCSWDTNYSLVFSGEGDSMSAPAAVNFVPQGAVPPGEVITISVPLTAPSSPGEYKGYWKMRNAAGGVFFGVSKGIWAAIKVVAFGKSFNLASNTCSAVWRNSSDLARPPLPCPGKEGSASGYVFYSDQPRFFNRDDDEPSFQVEPQQVNDGLIVGAFPPVLIPAKTRLRTFVGCGAKAEKCNVRVIVSGQPLEGSEVTLKDVVVKPSDDLVLINIDLESAGLAGRDVIFRFYVRANGSPEQDKMVFLSPIVEPIP